MKFYSSLPIASGQHGEGASASKTDGRGLESHPRHQIEMNLYKEELIALLSGLTTRKNKEEIWWVSEIDEKITVASIDKERYIVDEKITVASIDEERYMVRAYYSNGNKRLEAEYKNGLAHGKVIHWYENNQKMSEQEYKNNQIYGKGIGWDSNGKKEYETEYF